jgi:hypothetical protein
MSDAPSDARRRLVQTRWVHVEGDDAERGEGAIFRDAAGDIPLSRRPKEYLEFSEDGTVRKLATGADDRAHEIDRATWREDKGHVVFHFATKGGGEYRIVEQDANRLVVRRT